MEFRSFDNGLKQQQGGMQNGDKASPSIISATLEQHCMFCILIHFNIVYYQRRSFKCQPMYSNKALSPLFYYHSCMFVVFLFYDFSLVCLFVWLLFGLIFTSQSSWADALLAELLRSAILSCKSLRELAQLERRTSCAHQMKITGSSKYYLHLRPFS